MATCSSKYYTKVDLLTSNHCLGFTDHSKSATVPETALWNVPTLESKFARKVRLKIHFLPSARLKRRTNALLDDFLGVGLTTEYGILASMVVIVLALLAAVITVYAVKWVKRPKDAGGLHQHEEESRSLDTMSSMQYLTEDEDTADESDSLLPSPTKPAAAAPRRRFPS